MTGERDRIDPALDAAWRAHVREGPPAALDDAVLAAAHRAVASGPRAAQRTPRRWPAWAPLAVAATLGAIAFGVVQLAPREEDATRSVVSDVPLASLRGPAPAARGAQAPDARVDGPAPDARADRAAPASADKATPPARAPGEKPVPPTEALADKRRGAAETFADRSNGLASSRRDAEARRAQPTPAAPPAAATTPKRQAAAPVAAQSAPVPAEPQATAPRSTAAPAARAPADAAEQDRLTKREGARDAGSAGDEATTPSSAPQPFPAAPRVAPAPPAFAPSPSPAPAPPIFAPAPPAAAPPPPAPMRSGAVAAKDSVAANATAPAAAPMQERAAEPRAKVATTRTPEDFVRDIRRLRGEGRDADAALALAAFRAAYADADERLPQDLRTWARTVARP